MAPMRRACLLPLVPLCLGLAPSSRAAPPPLANPLRPGAYLAGARLAGLDLAGIDLSGANLASADLSGTILTRANLKGANLARARLKGAQLQGANLAGANLRRAVLSNDPARGIKEAANLTGAFLKNVNLAEADLSGATFAYANLYGTRPAATRPCPAVRPSTPNCATVAGARLKGTDFTGAFLYGTDFTRADLEGARFSRAVLVGTRFDRARLTPDPATGAGDGFTAAFLQGALLAKAGLNGISLHQAQLDFRPAGNLLVLELPGTHTVFRGSREPGAPACLRLVYRRPTTVPGDQAGLVCPDGSLSHHNQPAGCGRTAPGGHWAAPAAIGQAGLRASFGRKATFAEAGPPVCARPDRSW
jgi:uncharacterized protein YjbI with pentapeptide repeats